MTREAALMVMVAVALVLLALGLWAWRRRAQRDSAFSAPFGELPASAVVHSRFSGFYVATTRHGEPLERLAIRGLGFRSRADVLIADAGIAIDVTGQSRMFLDVSRLVTADRATVAIDRVVEKDGLVRIVWLTDDGTPVDSYFRPQDASAGAFADALTRILPDSAPTTPTGSEV